MRRSGSLDREGQGRPRRARGDDGAALVEFVLVVPLFIILILGMVTAGIVYNHKLDMTHAAREGARYGATIPIDQCTPTSVCDGMGWAQLVQSIVVDRSDGDVTQAQVCVALVTGTGTVVGGGNQSLFAQNGASSSTTQCFDDGNGDSGYRVQVSIHRTDDTINAAFFTIPVPLSSSATAKLEQQQ
jgi:Flp pilus assembly protein TadG